MIHTLTILGAVAEQIAVHFEQARPDEGAGYPMLSHLAEQPVA